MSHILKYDEILIIEKYLTADQTDFLARHIQNNVYDTMLGRLVESGKIRRMKNVDDEDLYYLADEYELIERRVAPEGERFECDEGHKNLKYLYVVRNVEDGKIIKLGGTCLKNLTGLSGDVINALIKCFDGIDREYERILLALRNGEWENQKEYLNIDDLPATMKRQLELELPLSELQQSKIEKYISRYFAEKERKEQEQKRLVELQKQRLKVLDEMSKEQKSYYDQCSSEERDFLVKQCFTSAVMARDVDIDRLNLTTDMKDRIRLDLPLTHIQESVLAAAQKEVKLQDEKERIRVAQKRVEAKQAYYTYNEILEKFEEILGKLKATKDATKSKCPGTYARVIEMIRKAKNGEKVKGRDLILELQGLSNAMGWGYDLY